MIWDNSFCQNGEKPVEEVTWEQLGQVLSSWFKMHTGRGLSDNNVRCLGRKLLRSDHVSEKVEIILGAGELSCNSTTLASLKYPT